MGFLREQMFKAWYAIVSKLDKNADVLFMNYGYAEDGFRPEMQPEDEINRYSAQLYHLLGKEIDIKGLHIAEIGCGRGGGLSYLHRTFSPKKSLGMDLNPLAIKFCNRNYPLEGLTFIQGDAQNLHAIPDESLDVVFNVESSHRYPRMDLFLSEVWRVLKPGGTLLLTDFRFEKDVERTDSQITESGMEVIKRISTNKNVVTALDADDSRRRTLVKNLVPRPLQSVARNFAGTVGSNTYNMFVNGGYQYFYYVLRKKNA